MELPAKPRVRACDSGTWVVLTAVVLALGALLAAPACAQESERTYRVVAVDDDDVLNIRAGPSAGYAAVGSIPPHARGVRVVGPCRGWCQVQYAGATGWVNGRFLAPETGVREDTDARKRAQLPAYWRVTGMMEGDSLQVHEGPSAQTAVVHAFEPQSGCIKLAGTCRKPWCQVSFPGLAGDRTGWVDANKLEPSPEECGR